MSIHVTDFKWEKGKNDVQYIELLEKTLKTEQTITAKAISKIGEQAKELKKIRAKAIDEFAERLRPLLNTYHDQVRLEEIADQMKGGAE